MKTEEALFAEAVELPAAKRASFIELHCGKNSELRNRIEALIAAHESHDNFLDHADLTSSRRVEIGQNIGSYRLLQELGEGGFGVVFMAEQRQPIRRQVALKIIKPGMDSKAVVARFEAERQALAMMSHPNIATVFDGGTVENDGRPYFVMELVQGVPITEYCDANMCSTAERLELFISVCNAVHHAHQKGIIHRDIKPSNVMVTLHDGKPVVKVIDFGVAKAIHSRLTEKTMSTQYGMLVGTPQYMSPEQAEMSGLDVDTRSDVYSLAVLLYELLTGSPPLLADSLRTAGVSDLQRMICEVEPERPSKRLSSSNEKLEILAKHRGADKDRLPRELQGDLDWIVLKGLEKDRQRRYDSASDFAADVRRSLNEQPVKAGPPSMLYRAKKFFRRNRAQVLAVAAFVAFTLAIAGGLIFARIRHLDSVHKDEVQLLQAIEEATGATLALTEAAPSDERWENANLLADRVTQLTSNSIAGESVLSQAKEFLDQYETAEKDRRFVESMEELLVSQATSESLENWTSMEIGFRRILKDRGYDVDSLSPEEMGELLHEDPSKVKLTDALELWLATRRKLADSGRVQMEEEEINSWTTALCVADPNPLRTSIRKAVFATVPSSNTILEEVVSKSNLSNVCARKLSWLAEAFKMTGDIERSNEIQNFALSLHPNDLMLNFEHAHEMMKQKKFSQAIRYFMRCTAIRPKVAGVWRALAKAHEEIGEADAARAALDVANRLDR